MIALRNGCGRSSKSSPYCRKRLGICGRIGIISPSRKGQRERNNVPGHGSTRPFDASPTMNFHWRSAAFVCPFLALLA